MNNIYKLIGIPLYVVVFALYSCHNQENREQEVLNPENQQTADSAINAEIPPVDIIQLKKLDWLTTTSGILDKKKSKDLCSSKSSDGFFGFYFLIDRNSGIPIGSLTVHLSDSVTPAKWRSDNELEEFIEINLKSKKILIWDNIHIGMNEKELLKVIKSKFHYRKGTIIYSDFDAYEGTFSILGDTINELTIKLKCK